MRRADATRHRRRFQPMLLNKPHHQQPAAFFAFDIRPDESPNDGFHRNGLAARITFDLVQLGVPAGADLRRQPIEQRVGQFLLRSEMIVDRREVRSGVGRNLPHRRGFDAAGREQPFGGPEDGLLGLAFFAV